MIAVIIIVVVLVVVIGGLVLSFNGLVRKRTRTEEAWSQIDVVLKRRHDLIPNLVETVKGYAAHESSTLEAVTAARSGAVAASNSGDPAAVGAAENALSQTLRSLFAVAEAYPQLKAVDSFLQLQEELTATEDKIEFARRYYNTSVRDYNTAIQTFPRNMIANTFGYHPVVFFQADEPDRAVPGVSFSGPSSTPSAAAPPAVGLAPTDPVPSATPTPAEAATPTPPPAEG